MLDEKIVLAIARELKHQNCIFLIRRRKKNEVRLHLNHTTLVLLEGKTIFSFFLVFIDLIVDYF